MAAGEHHSLVMNLYCTEIYAFGRADYGQLGIGKTKTGDAQSIPKLIKFPCSNNTENTNNALNTSCTNEYPIFSKIACGDRNSMAITNDNIIYTWGFNETGTTGHKVIDVEYNDIYIPTILNLNEHLLNHRAPVIQTYDMSGGGQHTLLLIKRYRSS